MCVPVSQIRCPYPPESKAIRSTCRGFRAVCGVSRRRAVSEMALLGATTSCVNLLAATMPVQAAILEPDVIRKWSRRIILVCQGATQNSCEGSLDEVGYAPLDMLGLMQTQKTSELLLDLKVNSIICSPQVASVDTATTICELSWASTSPLA